MDNTPEKFNDIRPYLDEEIPDVMKRLVKNTLLTSTIRLMIWPKCPDFLNGLVEFAIRFYLGKKLKKIKTVYEFQAKIVGDFLLKWVLDNSTDGLTYSGLENLPKDNSYIFISNHRDIVLDPAFIDYLLHTNGHRVPYIAFGDNLLINELVTDLIMVNKSFIVKRNLPPREALNALKHLSEYINYLLRHGEHLWIAQREGRAKDGIDQTNPAIIKMFYLSERKKSPDFNQYINSLNIVPVAISYEKDPCDRIKAWELYRKNKKGVHKKKKNEDLVAMAAGISKDKGKVHVEFGRPIQGNFEDDKAVAKEIDKAIHSQYKLWPRNYIAYDIYYKTDKYSDFYTEMEKTSFLSSYNNLKPEILEIIFQIYANPVSTYEASQNPQN